MVGLNVYGSDQLMPEDREAIAAYLKPVPLMYGGGLRLYAHDRSKAGRELIT